MILNKARLPIDRTVLNNAAIFKKKAGKSKNVGIPLDEVKSVGFTEEDSVNATFINLRNGEIFFNEDKSLTQASNNKSFQYSISAKFFDDLEEDDILQFIITESSQPFSFNIPNILSDLGARFFRNTAIFKKELTSREDRDTIETIVPKPEVEALGLLPNDKVKALVVDADKTVKKRSLLRLNLVSAARGSIRITIPARRVRLNNFKSGEIYQFVLRK